MKYLDPIAAITQPREDFIRYLLTAYPLRDRTLRDKLKEKLEQPGIVWQHPYLEGSQPYQSASSVQELVEQSILHPRVADLFTPNERRLYEHQQNAIQAVNNGENIIVATGTGSGKTECFLIPMMDMLLKEGDIILRSSGVRALILYPMNALVNDQVKRLRGLLCRQDPRKPLIRFGFYTSRTETEHNNARESLREELGTYESSELQALFTHFDTVNISTRDRLINEAVEKIQTIQEISRRDIWENPPHILVTNYSMLEHMLIRPTERRVFAASSRTFKMLVLDEAHTYNGSTGSEVSMLLKRLKAAINHEQEIRCIATSASLGEANIDDQVKIFARELFGETFSQVIRGNRVTALERLGRFYDLAPDHTDAEVLEYLSTLKLPETEAIADWLDRLLLIVPTDRLAEAEAQANNDFHRLLWFALKGHPLIHRLINILSTAPQPWDDIAKSARLWNIDLPTSLDGSLDQNVVIKAKEALARLLQLGTLARENAEDLPLLPVRLHLLFRSLEGIYSCINPTCRSLYLNEKLICDDCSSPVLELGSCSQCGQDYAFTLLDDKIGELKPLPRSNQALKNDSKIYTKIYTLTLNLLGTKSEDEDDDEIVEEVPSNSSGTFKLLENQHGWIGVPSENPIATTSKSTPTTEKEFLLQWHWDKGKAEGCYLPKCAACGARPNRSLAINRFVAYTDAPLEAMVDSLFELLPEPTQSEDNISKRKLLTFSDGRQDAAFFASDYQRTHTEMLYRQTVWQAFQSAKKGNGIANVNKFTKQLQQIFLDRSIPHPDRDSERNHKSYCPQDPIDGREAQSSCEDWAEERAKELLLREFAIPFARRSSLEAFAILACHIELLENDPLVGDIAELFGVTNSEAYIFLIGLTDIIRRTGIVSISGASKYFPETGGVDGARPPMIDVQGKSKNYLFLEKDPKEAKSFPDSPSFLPKWKNSGEVSKAQNRLGWFYAQMFENNFPTREKFISLFRKLEGTGLLVKAKNGHQIKWDLLNVIETQEDWYQCDRCQQVVHVPNLSTFTDADPKPTLNVYACRSFKCEGTLKPYTSKRIHQAETEHYQQTLIKNREPLSLRSQEHTAQLGTEELAKRENAFRRGQINLLSCSTTLEMGVDIGELQAVVLRNFPPHVSNYQQRAGRAGRRTDGVAITLMYGQRRPHDRYYFEQPDKLIAGSNQIPKVDAGNWQIQQRHIRAELLAAFLSIFSIGAEKVNMQDFLGLPNPLTFSTFTPPSTAMVCELKEWLHSDRDRATQLAQDWIVRLQGSGTAAILLSDFREKINEFQQEQCQDWNDLIDPLKVTNDDISAESDRNKRKGLERRRDGLEFELEKIAKRKLHDELVQASILPIYGFPIDVVRLLTGESNEYKSSQGKHRLERDRRLALGEYAPGQDVVVDDRVYRSVGISRPKDLEKKYYWVCKNCNHFLEFNTQNNQVEQCPICQHQPKLAIDKAVNEYKVPKAFVTDWAATAKVTPYLKPIRQITSQVFLANPGSVQRDVSEENICHLTVNQNGTFFLANKGQRSFTNQGFYTCESCGLDLSEKVRKWEEEKRKLSRSKKAVTTSPLRPTHLHPLNGKTCSGQWNLIHLGHEFKTDFLKIKFDDATKPSLLHEKITHTLDGHEVASETENSNSRISFWRSLTYALLAAAAQVIDVRREELDGLFRPLENGQAEIIIYDNVPGGAGYSQRIADNFKDILTEAHRLADSCSCEHSCYDCLRTYSNQLFHHELDRKQVVDFLKPIVEQVSPDPVLQAFAPSSSRVRLEIIASALTAHCRMATTGSIIYLPQLIDQFCLDRGEPMAWLNKLSDMVKNCNPLVLILHELPQVISDHNLVLRKRLSQWIDQGLVKLYQTDINEYPTLYLYNAPQNCLALGLSQESNQKLVWLQTRSHEGVNTVLQRLNNWLAEAREVQATELEDANTQVIFPEPAWGILSLTELRQRLGLERVLTGSRVTQVTYQDRYLDASGARYFVNLLQGEWLDTSTQIIVHILEDLNKPDRLERLTERLVPISGQVRQEAYISGVSSRDRFVHARSLEIEKEDGQHYRILFDKGMDFMKRHIDQTYEINESTYVVITRQ